MLHPYSSPTSAPAAGPSPSPPPGPRRGPPSPPPTGGRPGGGPPAPPPAAPLPGAPVLATDASSAALAVAAANAQRHGVADRIVFAQADLLAPPAGPLAPI